MSVSSQGNYEGLSVTSGWVEEGGVGGARFITGHARKGYQSSGIGGWYTEICQILHRALYKS
jgi:hypothetical protein